APNRVLRQPAIAIASPRHNVRYIRPARREMRCMSDSLNRPPRVRLAELIATLSLGTDLGFGQPMEHVLRQCLIALRLGERLGLGETERRVLYYSGLLAWVGCFTDAYEQAKWFGDDISLKADAYAMKGGEVGYFLGHLGMGRSLSERFLLGIA